MTETLADQLATEESVFAQTAQGIESDRAKLTLQWIAPATLYFSDRPQRVVGQMATTDLVDLWAIGDDSFETDPPNAVLSFLESGADASADALAVLTPPGGHYRPSPYAVCVGASDDGIRAGSEHEHDQVAAPALSWRGDIATSCTELIDCETRTEPPCPRDYLQLRSARRSASTTSTPMDTRRRAAATG